MIAPSTAPAGTVLEIDRVYVCTIIKVDSEAVVASRFLNTMVNGGDPSCSDISDVAFHVALGYTRLMLGDELCMSEKSMTNAVRAFAAITLDGE